MTSTMMASWEDEETNRHIQFAAEYPAANGTVEVIRVTPLKVSLCCPRTKAFLRTISVHTEKGRRLLVSQLIDSGQLAAIAEQVRAWPQVGPLKLRFYSPRPSASDFYQSISFEGRAWIQAYAWR